MKTADSVFRLGTGEGRYEATRGVKLSSARQFGDTVAFNCTAADDLRLDIVDLRRAITELLRKLSEGGGTTMTGVPGVIAGLADALTALRCLVEAQKGLRTRPEWWRGWYHKLVSDQHRYCWPRTKVAVAFDPPPVQRAVTRKAMASANFVGIAELRQARLMAEATAAAAERAAQAERAQIAAATRVEPSGQIAAAF